MPKVSKTKVAEITLHSVAAKQVFVAGAFNGWNPEATPLQERGPGHWSVRLELPRGRHEYKFIVDGTWCCDAGCDGPHLGCPGCVANTFGTMNRVVEVK